VVSQSAAACRPTNQEIRTMRYSLLAAAVALGVLWQPALAQETGSGATDGTAEARAKVRSACAADAEKFCGGVERGKGGGMRACFEAHASELSAACKAARSERAATRAKERS
jgi:hypothetical protein